MKVGEILCLVSLASLGKGIVINIRVCICVCVLLAALA